MSLSLVQNWKKQQINRQKTQERQKRMDRGRQGKWETKEALKP